MSSSDASTSGGLSVEDLPPLELNKCLHLSIERYPNLLKHFQVGKSSLNFTLITHHASDLTNLLQALWETKLVMSQDQAHPHQKKVITKKMMRIMFQMHLTWVGIQMMWKSKELKLKVHIWLTCTIGLVMTTTMSACQHRRQLLIEYFLQYLFIYLFRNCRTQVIFHLEYSAHNEIIQ